MRGLSSDVRTLLQKARDSALLAVETYNRPTATFRSGAYVVLMVIAWTSLFHAVFLRNGIKPYYRKKNSRRYVRIDGEPRAWELDECINRHYGNQNSPERSNLELISRLRNKIEHRSYPQLDAEIFGECQALLLNFEDLMVKEFGVRNALRTSLVFALQFSRSIEQSQTTALTRQSSRSFENLKNFVQSYRSTLSEDIAGDQKFSFKVFLIPKITGRQKAGDVAVEFVRYDPTRPDEMAKYDHVVGLIKETQIPISNLGHLKAGEVIRQITDRIPGKSFNHFHHKLFYQHFNVRPSSNSQKPEVTDRRFCVYDAVHKDYVYKRDWVEFLAEKLKDSTFLTKLIDEAKNRKM